MSKKAFAKEQMIKVQGGRDYLPVAPRIVMFRSEHPEWSVVTEPVEIAGDQYMRATVSLWAGNGRSLVATAHKRVNPKGRGAAKDYPVETAETGAIGRALALCGYGTLSGDLDEGEELADAPVERGNTPVKEYDPVAEAQELEAMLPNLRTSDDHKEYVIRAQRLPKGAVRTKLGDEYKRIYPERCAPTKPKK